MKKNRNLYSLLFIFVVAFGLLFSNKVYAKENNLLDLSYLEYQYYVKTGVLGTDVSYSDWRMLVETSRKLEEYLTNSDEFEMVYSSKDKMLREAFVLERGDVLITNGTSSAGITGHAGIALSDDSILHIAGKGMNPDDINLATWHTDYTYKKKTSWTKVYRHIDNEIAESAATWAEDTYLGSSAEYKITSDLSTTHVTYCSKIVWQAYHYGPENSVTDGIITGYRAPYVLPSVINDLKLQHKYRK